MGTLGVLVALIGLLILIIGVMSVMNIFGILSKDERHQSNTTDNRVQRLNIKIILIGLAMTAIGFVMVFVNNP